MAEREHQSNNPESEQLGVGEAAFAAIGREIQNIQRDVIRQLDEDIQRLRREKSQLSGEIEDLKSRGQQWQSQQLDTLRQQQLVQQQELTQQLAQLVVARLDEVLQQRLESSARSEANAAIAGTTSADLAELVGGTHRMGTPVSMMNAAKVHANGGFTSLQRELSNHRSRLSQQLGRMTNLEQQAGLIVQTLIERLEQKEGAIIHTPMETAESFTNGAMVPDMDMPPPPAAAPPAAKPISQTQLGFLLALASAATLSIFNVSIRILLGKPNSLFPWFLDNVQVGGLISPSLGNSLLILFLRVVVVVVVMPFVVQPLYPLLVQDIQRFWRRRDPQFKLQVVAHGFSLFLSQVFIYVALGQIPTGVAITIFFVFPIVTVLASWPLFGDRPSFVRWVVLGTIGVGAILSLPNFFGGASGNVPLGVSSALAAGISFACYVLLTQVCSKKLHPVPLSLMQFCVILACCIVGVFTSELTGFGNMLPFGEAIARTDLLLGGAYLGILTLIGYLLNNIAIRFAGAALASIVGATGPAMTALFALVVINEKLTGSQVAGMVLVTLGVLGLNLERTLKRS